MFRFMRVVSKKIVSAPRNIAVRLAQHANMSTSLLCRSSSRKQRSDGIKVTDIDIYDLAKGDKEFTRNFLTSMSVLTKGNVESPASSTKPEDTAETNSIGDEAPGSSGPATSCGSSSVLDRDGNPIVPIEIDGWNQDYEDGDLTVQKNNSVDIGNDEEYKQEMCLKVPEKREGHFEYKGIKITLPKSASKDIGTYRFRRDAEDFETVADDIRVVKYDKK
ncbi:uncharacterized protein Dwil_GK15047 [Drosophila willistoni]|uniref:Uncharacterized protein n=1 Tax=Drosophila willistoni TaxID=7260 RepID=B4MVK3_DROWI|nr:uncharacterized protein LOC6642568 [Drosophila willistoni]EDW75723.1 uncharacterized protein Dwil_GK15047 [Drosophila willistoni]